MTSSLHPGTPYTTPGTFAGLESEHQSGFQFGRGLQTDVNANVPIIPRGYTGMPEI